MLIYIQQRSALERALDFDELERDHDEALRRAGEAPGQRREALGHLRLAAVS